MQFTSLEVFSEISELLPGQPMAWICTAPPTRRAQEKSGRGLCLGFNRYQQIGASSFHKKRRVRLRCDVHDVYGLRLTRWWLQRCSGASPVAVDRNSGLQSPGIRVVGDVVLPAPPQLSDDGECPLSVYCWGNQKVSATSKSQCTNCAILPHLNWSLGDLLSLGRIEYLEIDGAGLSPTPAEWQSCLAFSRGVKEFRINAGAVPLNELLSFLYSNGSTLQSVKISGVTLPRLQVFALAPRIEKMVLRNVTVHPQPVVVVNLSNEGRPPAASQLCKRVPLSDLAALQNLHKLDLMNCKADFDCAGIGRCTLLRSLFLSGCNISDGDVEAIGELRQVEELSLARTRVTNVRPLASAESLRVLLLTNTMVNSAGIEGLQKLPNLIRLDLSSTPITDVNCLSTSSSLTYLNLSKTGVAAEGIQELRRLATLEHLVLNETSVRSVSFLANAQSLKALSLQSTLVDTNGIDGFRRLKTLQDLCLAHTRVTRVTELQHCDHLWRIDLQGTLVDEDGIAGLELLPSLRVLYLSRTDVGDLSLVLESKSLEQLEVKFSRVSRMNPFSGVSRKSPLKEVVLTHCDATDVNDLGLCEGLRVLHLRSTKVTTEGIAGLRDAQNLHEVDLSETGVTDIAPLLGCCQMRTLILYKTMLRSIDGVEALRNLQRLDVAETQVSSIKGLGQCKHLEVLDVSNTPVDDEGFRGIEGAQSLKAVSLSFTPVTQLGALGRCAHLEEVQAQSCPVTSEGLVGLEKAFRLTKLNLSYTRIQGNIERFAICQSLQTLNVKFTDVPLEEVQHVEMCLPRCCVMNDAAVRTKKDVTLT